MEWKIEFSIVESGFRLVKWNATYNVKTVMMNGHLFDTTIVASTDRAVFI